MTVTRLSPLDASFLAVETPTAHMHVGWAAIFEPPADGARPSFEELREHIAAPAAAGAALPADAAVGAARDQRPGLGRRPRLRRRPPRGAGASRTGSARWSSECMSKPLPRDRPLWQVWIADRLDDGRIGVVGKAHHCMVDGIAAVELGTPAARSRPRPPRRPSRTHGPRSRPRAIRSCSARGLADLARSQLDLAAIPARAAALAAPSARARLAGSAGARPRSSTRRVRRRPAPQLNPPISPLRQLGLLARPIDDLPRDQGERSASSSTTSCWPPPPAGVRAFLRKRGETPDPPQDDGPGQRPRVRRGRSARQPDLVHVRRPSLRRARPGAPAARDPRRDQRPQARREAGGRGRRGALARLRAARRSSAWSRG